ncbi:hypothetical protein CL633_01820 [bacterium]|nr:hypothetical protein [bacterium]|tara:strand:- start:1145 stop:1633 length:489 start_codon:yes stop_codon:yes gene_type:complete
MKYHRIVKKIINLLEQNNCWFKTFEHKPVKTSQEAAKIRTGYSLQQGAKALIIRIKKHKNQKEFVMLVMPAHLRFNSQKVKELFQARDIRFAQEQEIAELTEGVQIGGIPPFGNLFDLKVIADAKLFENKKIIFNAGDRKFSIAMKAEDFKKLVKPEIANIV